VPSLQANHSRSCALGRAWTPFDQARVGCTCPDGPFYYVVVRAGQHAHKEAVGRDRHQAEIALRRVAAAVDDGSFRPRPTIGFLEWADRWLASLERKPSTVGSYRSTIAHAKEVFGSQRVRGISPEDIARFNGILRERGCSASTRAKHLRVLGACLQAAVSYRYADSNPVRELPSAQRPRPERKEAAYFENDELPRLFEHLLSEAVRTVCLVALKTGMRQGELFALRWADVDLEEAVIRVRSSYTGGALSTPKNRERRDVDLISGVVELLSRLRDRARTKSSSFPARTVRGTCRRPLCLDVTSTQQWLPRRSHGSGRRRRNGRSTASGTRLRSGRLRAVLRSHGSRATSATRRSRSQPTSMATGSVPSGSSKRRRWRMPSQFEDPY
jgi:integrase